MRPVFIVMITMLLVLIAAAALSMVMAYDRCHYETRMDNNGYTYTVLVCCDNETGKCRITRVGG